MFFNSWIFAVFFAVFYVLYINLRGRSRKYLLLAGSYVFYGFWDSRFLILIFLSTVVDFYIGKAIYRSKAPKAKRLIALSLCFNLGVLAYFKYANFFIDSAQLLLSQIGIENNWSALNVILPVGISFYTFQTISYSIDIYRKELKPTDSFLDFACFVGFFPQLVAGPIERAKALLPQMKNPQLPSRSKIDLGVLLILLGLFKKIVIADSCCSVVDYSYANPEQSPYNTIIIAVFFSFQIYADFSGYTDIARGLALTMGIKLSLNFLKPYMVGSPSEFWRNWHISLSSWLRDYLYIPLGGNRQGGTRTNCNLMITMVLGGLWHGAGWAFVLWGFFHGIWLVLHRMAAPKLSGVRKLGPRFYAITAIVVTYAISLGGWHLFRLGSVEQSMQLETLRLSMNKLIHWDQVNTQLLFPMAFYGFLVFFLQHISSKYDEYEHCSFIKKGAILFLLIGSCFLLGRSGGAQFIYFQF